MEISLVKYDWFVVCFFLILSCILFYQGWINLAKKEVTKFFLDAVVLAYLRIIRGKRYVANAVITLTQHLDIGSRKSSRNPTRLIALLKSED
jgi:hypothetical protein